MKSLESLSDLFNKYVFRIPEYQRGYAWKEKQIHDFWNDLMNLDISRNHYTGMISLETIDKHNDKQGWNSDDNWIFKDKEDACYVIDGQQRLTTSVILIFSILKFCRANNINNLNGISLDDIESVDYKGNELVKIYIEVKSTKDVKDTSFFVSKNEVEVSKTKKDQYRIFRIFDLTSIAPKYYIADGEIEDNFYLDPITYSATYKYDIVTA